VGTGPFREISRNLKTIKLIKYEQYWDDFTSFPWSIILQKTANKYQRIGEIFDGKTNLVADFPPVFAQQIESRTEALIKQTRGVKSVFVLFNLKSDFLAKRSNRQALNLAINRRELNEELGNANRLINQFTGSGVFGYNPDIDDPQSSLILAQDQLELGNQRIFNLALAKENQVLGEFIQRQLEPLGIRLRLKMVNSAELIELVQKGEEDMYLMGWDYSGGSVDVFYRDLVQSSGKYNGLNYGNEELDLKIKKALNELNEEKRLLALQEIMQIITSEDPLGIPLFAIDNIYALYPSPYSASIRPDGIIHFR
jgi:peptide/nickel transport system substrate-binding protein